MKINFEIDKEKYPNMYNLISKMFNKYKYLILGVNNNDEEYYFIKKGYFFEYDGISRNCRCPLNMGTISYKILTRPNPYINPMIDVSKLTPYDIPYLEEWIKDKVYYFKRYE